MKKNLFLLLAMAMLSMSLLAQEIETEEGDEECDSETDCRESQVKDPVENIYPYRPFEVSRIKERLIALTENNQFLWNIQEMDRRGLNRANTTNQPWGGSFWPLAQGMIGNSYQDKDYSTFIFSARKHLSWKRNVSIYKKRKENVHPQIWSLDENELAKLAPSEKYDILLGDTSFDLTNRIWNYAQKWGEEKKWGFLSMIDLPEGYHVPVANKFMALWEGICHGWAVAAGHSPRPEKTVWFKLPNGKRMPFYPNDIKALVSLMWVNSNIQANVILEGDRCNIKHPDQDKFGRYIDTEIDKVDKELLPRCADVHPAIFHVALINILGVEGRSFVADVNPKAAIANQPISGYEIRYFNPRTAKFGGLNKTLISLDTYGSKDKFSESRNPETTHVVGVAMKLKYVDWEYPKKKESNSPMDDKIKELEFLYDLEINASGNVVGGQWRTTKKGREAFFNRGNGRPDFFWVVPKDWKNYFKPMDGLPSWNPRTSAQPPKEWLKAAHITHGNIYEESPKLIKGMLPCPVFPINGEGEILNVDCAFKYPRPQPLIQVVDKLLEMSR